jgi:hypothetical protein
MVRARLGGCLHVRPVLNLKLDKDVKAMRAPPRIHLSADIHARKSRLLPTGLEGLPSASSDRGPHSFAAATSDITENWSSKISESVPRYYCTSRNCE